MLINPLTDIIPRQLKLLENTKESVISKDFINKDQLKKNLQNTNLISFDEDEEELERNFKIKPTHELVKNDKS